MEMPEKSFYYNGLHHYCVRIITVEKDIFIMKETRDTVLGY